MIARGLGWKEFWLGMGVVGLVIGGLLLFLLPSKRKVATADGKATNITQAFGVVFRNPQSILCGLIAGLLFIPTTIFDMIWGVRYLQEAHGLDFATSVMRSASVPFGWIIGCPLLGFISDRLGRRKPVIIGGAVLLLACLAWILFGPANIFPPFTLGLLTGIASGAAMLPYTVIKEANPPQLGGTATGVVNFINFTFSALLAPVFGWLLQRAAGGAVTMESQHYQAAFLPLLFGVGIAIVLCLFLKETGPATRRVTELTN
jgi:sugar phosphate permease